MSILTPAMSLQFEAYDDAMSAASASAVGRVYWTPPLYTAHADVVNERDTRDARDSRSRRQSAAADV